MNYQIVRISKANNDFTKLVEELDRYLTVTDEDEHEFYDQFNSVDRLKHIVIAYYDNEPVGCGAFKEMNATSTEIKRMYVTSEMRGTGLAKLIIDDLEAWSKKIGFRNCVLETGKRQNEAVKFYTKCGYKTIPNYDQYIGMENSLCFKKELI